VKYAFMRAHQDQFKVSRMCRALEVSRSGYYSRTGKESKRSEQNRAVLVEIKKVHEENREAYGAVKTWRELKAQGIVCGRHRVARLRRQAGIEAGGFRNSVCEAYLKKEERICRRMGWERKLGRKAG
jgi:putative transposase